MSEHGKFQLFGEFSQCLTLFWPAIDSKINFNQDAHVDPIVDVEIAAPVLLLPPNQKVSSNLDYKFACFNLLQSLFFLQKKKMVVPT